MAGPLGLAPLDSTARRGRRGGPKPWAGAAGPASLNSAPRRGRRGGRQRPCKPDAVRGRGEGAEAAVEETRTRAAPPALESGATTPRSLSPGSSPCGSVRSRRQGGPARNEAGTWPPDRGDGCERF
ncbi:hypothetical protein C2845_PM01G12860 [Panicum miliaceum]|uniref:Uncharacterized protein n=1 Tax=Panicum miliaceum TaxID=4540 RepID=A0A3L6TPU6_PANMI|nr:hypothetical protein C2845_PM01G12860 [Panicum miliaceum]